MPVGTYCSEGVKDENLNVLVFELCSPEVHAKAKTPETI